MLKVSIIIPTYNRKELFEAALKSALAQDYENKEIIISDDNSNDGTRELAQSYVAKFDNVKYVLNQTYNRGPNGNKNNGFDHASGDAFVILDDDDLLIEGAISKMAIVLEQGYASVWANCYFEIDGEPTTKFSGFGLSKSGEISPQDYYDGKITGEFLIMFRRDAIGQRRFKKGLYGSENTLWIYLFDLPAYYLHDAVRIYRFHRSDSVTINSFKRPLCIMKGYAMTAELILQKIAEKNAQAYGAKNIKFAQKAFEDDWSDVPACDVVFASRCLEVDDLKTALKKLLSKTKKSLYITFKVGGSFIDDEILDAIGREAEQKPDFVYLLNILFQMGYLPSLSYIKAWCHSGGAKSVEEFVQKTRWMLGSELNEAEEARLAEYFNSGKYEPKRDFMYWAFVRVNKTDEL